MAPPGVFPVKTKIEVRACKRGNFRVRTIGRGGIYIFRAKPPFPSFRVFRHHKTVVAIVTEAKLNRRGPAISKGYLEAFFRADVESSFRHRLTPCYEMCPIHHRTQ